MHVYLPFSALTLFLRTLNGGTMNPCLDPFWTLPDLRSADVLHCMIVEHDCNKSTLTTIDSAPPCETLPRLFSGAWTGNLSVHAPVETHLFKKAYLFWELSKISLNWTELEWRCQKSVHTMSIAQVDMTCHIQRRPTCYQVSWFLIYLQYPSSPELLLQCTSDKWISSAS